MMMKNIESIELSKVATGKLLRLVKIKAGRQLNHRLLEMGLTPGVEFKILQNSGGPLLLAVRDSRIALGRSMADRIHVQLVTDQNL